MIPVNLVRSDGVVVGTATINEAVLITAPPSPVSVPVPPPAPVPPPPPPAGVTSLTDSAGSKWAITTKGKVTRNGAPPTTPDYTNNVTLLTYIDGWVYQTNTAGGWWRIDTRATRWPADPSAWVATKNPLINAVPVPTPTPAPTPAPSTALDLLAKLFGAIKQGGTGS